MSQSCYQLELKAGQVETAGECGKGGYAALKELLIDRIRVVGPDYPDTMTARHNLAHLQGEVGDVAGAAAASKRLPSTRLPVLLLPPQ